MQSIFYKIKAAQGKQTLRCPSNCRHHFTSCAQLFPKQVFRHEEVITSVCLWKPENRTDGGLGAFPLRVCPCWTRLVWDGDRSNRSQQYWAVTAIPSGKVQGTISGPSWATDQYRASYQPSRYSRQRQLFGWRDEECTSSLALSI